jgi:copper chaperone CopZ
MKKFKVTGMSCAACSARVERAVGSLDGVDSCSVNLLSHSMTVEGVASAEEIISAVNKAGYGAEIEEKIEPKDKNSSKLLILSSFWQNNITKSFEKMKQIADNVNKIIKDTTAVK